ncbi:hypothetical protein [Marinobacter nauticus]|uniref:hypothetical protein n=1 Tax=Marinobacter nauticus TaxID=2743 RepID=UPI00242D1B1B|nr:hypothetical protein [Marinobacter nauticus]
MTIVFPVRVLLSLIVYLVFVSIVILGREAVHPAFVVALVFIIYFLLAPTTLLDPRNMVFAFFVLFFVIPASVDYLFVVYELEYRLPWGRPWNWGALEDVTYIEVASIYTYIMIVFFLFLAKKEAEFKYFFSVAKGSLLFFMLMTLCSLAFFVYKTGGVSSWIFNYKETFLLQRSGFGLLNFVFIMLSNISVFLLGLVFYKELGLKKVLLLFLAVVFIFFVSYFQGLKSRFIILFLVFLSPYLISVPVTVRSMVFGAVVFLMLIFFFTYIRSDGFYSSPLLFLEYTMTYFNAFPLHDLIVKEGVLSVFSTSHQLLAKPASILGFEHDWDFDLSVMLTKEYFPNDWESMSATQQWPLLTDMRFNYLGFGLGWFFVLIYIAFLCYIFGKARKGSLPFLFIFVLEFVRIFSVMRGVLIPWQIFIYIPAYLLSFVVVRYCVKVFGVRRIASD